MTIHWHATRRQSARDVIDSWLRSSSGWNTAHAFADPTFEATGFWDADVRKMPPEYLCGRRVGFSDDYGEHAWDDRIPSTVSRCKRCVKRAENLHTKETDQ